MIKLILNNLNASEKAKTLQRKIKKSNTQEYNVPKIQKQEKIIRHLNNK